jgi:shikimate dehydrogenase
MKFGLLGKSLDHSFSPAYFTAKFASLQLPHSYEKLELAELSALRHEITKRQWDGFNVTIPYKEDILPFLDEISPEAKAIGAVNCVAIKNNRWVGYNTDAMGFEKSILPFLENHYPRALIIGTGGASKAVAFTLAKRGIDVFFLSRRAGSEHHLRYEDIDQGSMKHFPLIVQCSPVGTFPNVDEKPAIPYEGIGPQHALIDLIYNPEETAFLKEGKKRGAYIQNGLRMLQLQADLSWSIWNSQE